MDGCFLARRLPVAALATLATLARLAWVASAYAAVPTTTTTLPACQGLNAECHCADEVACTAIFECSQPTVSCAEVRAICLEHCAEHGGPGDCGSLSCIDTCSGDPCR